MKPVAAVALLAAMSLVFAACGATTPAQTQSASNGGGRPLSACHLRVRYRLSTAATQHVFASFQISTTSRAGCLSNGYPRVTLVDSDGRKLRTHAQREDGLLGFVRKPIRIAAGHPGEFVVGYSYLAPPNQGRLCRPVAAGLSVVLPNAGGTQVAPVPRGAHHPLNPCDGRLSVGPIFTRSRR